MKNQKNAFVLLETIVVTGVLGMVLIMMYPAFLNLINLSKIENNYDKVDYLYRTRAYNELVDTGLSASENYRVICEGNCPSNIYDAVAVYLINPKKISQIQNQNIYITTKKYLKYIDNSYDYDYTLLVVAYPNETDASDQNYEYASVRFLTKEERKRYYGME